MNCFTLTISYYWITTWYSWTSRQETHKEHLCISPLSCHCLFRAQSYAERLRLGLAVMHGEAQCSESDMADGRHSPPCVRNTFGHSGLELPCKSHHTVDLHKPAAWTLWLNIIKSFNQVKNTNLSSKADNWASKNSHKTCQKHVLLIFDPKNQKERKGYFLTKLVLIFLH